MNQLANSTSTSDYFKLLKEQNVKKAALQALAGDYSILTMPQWVSLGSTNRCNLECPHCYTHGTKERRSEFNKRAWPLDMLKRIANEILPTAFTALLTVNGEPLLTPRFADAIREFNYFGARLALTTNGTLLSDRNIAAIVRAARHIAISIDGATQLTYEAIRKGASFAKVLNNVRVLTRVNEFLDKAARVDILLACTLMGSNVRDLPEMVRLAKVLGISRIDYFPFTVFFDHVRNEDLSMHQERYNWFRQQAEAEAKRLGITLIGLQAPFPDVPACPEAPIDLPDMIVGPLGEDHYQQLPELESFLDQTAINARVDRVLSNMERDAEEQRNSIRHDRDACFDKPAMEFDTQLAERLDDLLMERRSASDIEFIYCNFLHRRVYVTHNGAVWPCCLPSVPELGNIHDDSLRDIWNGKRYNEFRQRFYSANPLDCCKDCRYRTRLSGRQLCDELVSGHL
jgi:radical SAM protein with 4Fe4S-binding SPASM domain